MNQKTNQRIQSNTYYKNGKEDSLNTEDIHSLLSQHIKKKLTYNMLLKGIINRPTYNKVLKELNRR